MARVRRAQGMRCLFPSAAGEEMKSRTCQARGDTLLPSCDGDARFGPTIIKRQTWVMRCSAVAPGRNGKPFTYREGAHMSGLGHERDGSCRTTIVIRRKGGVLRCREWPGDTSYICNAHTLLKEGMQAPGSREKTGDPSSGRRTRYYRAETRMAD